MIATWAARARHIVLLPVLGTFLASVALQLFGLLRAGRLVVDALDASLVSEAAAGNADAKDLVVSSIVLIDVFLLATAFLIIAAGLYELFIEELPLPAWLRFHDFDDLKVRLAAVILVGLIVAFFGEALLWRGGFDILALGGSIGIVMLATGIVFGPVGSGRRVLEHGADRA